MTSRDPRGALFVIGFAKWDGDDYRDIPKYL